MVYPKQVIIETSANCNLRCKGCPVNDRREPGGFMSEALVRQIMNMADQDYHMYTYKPTIVPWMNGEPLLNPQFTDIVKLIDSKGYKQYITTNGHYWKEELFNFILQENNVYQIIFSLDGTTGKTAAAARPGTDYEKVSNTIREFGRMKIKALSTIDMAVKICKRGQDYGEIERYIEQFLDCAYIDYVCVGSMLDTINDHEMRTCPCRYFDDMFLVIRHDGTIVPCAYHPKVVNDNYFQMGHIQNYNSLLGAYNSVPFMTLRNNQNRLLFRGPCQTCGFAYTGEGFSGEVTFRNSGKRYFYHQDYYNQFFSKSAKLEGSSWRTDA